MISSLRFKYFLSLANIVLTCQCESKIKSKPLFYRHQLVNHNLSNQFRSCEGKKWSQRYYKSDKYFQFPGPIFIILGGEEELKPENGIIYPFVSEHLAKYFSALVIQPEHRFYGKSQPLKDIHHVSNSDLKELMTPEQAMWDAVRLITHIRSKYNCALSSDKKSYCPVITVGGSYPGFLSAMMRFLHPSIVDAAYSASAPMEFYAQRVDQFAYYDHITNVAENCSTGCANAVKTALLNVVDIISNEVLTLKEAATKMGLCFIPSFMEKAEDFLNEIMMIVGYTFANYNMAYYPPGENTKLYQACQIFLNDTISFFDQLRLFFEPYQTTQTQFYLRHHHPFTNATACFDVTSQLPDGPNATISSGDWSGVGTQWSGNMWDFQTCSYLIEKIGFSQQSMFPPRLWTLEWLTDHCNRRFQVTPQPNALVDKWHFDKDTLIQNNASRILFTNGLNDGWSVSGIQTSLSSDVLAINFENGAHHSDLSGEGPTENDTDDVKNGFIQIRTILESFLDDIIKSKQYKQNWILKTS